MDFGLEQFIDEAIQLELNAADMYALFSKVIPEDANFWAALSWEERNHAALLKTGKDILMPIDQFPGNILPDFIQSLIETNRWLKSQIHDCLQNVPARGTAFAIAIKIESSAGEQHFQRVMAKPSDSKILQIFQELCEDDIHHLTRIKTYMNEAGELGEIPGIEAKRILIVIDDEFLAKLLTTILSTEGEVDVAGNGNDGLQQIKAKHYDLIISAVEMPLLDGLSFFNQAKEFSPDLNKRFLFFTSAPSSDRVSFFQNEKIKYLVKPSTINEIRGAALSMLA